MKIIIIEFSILLLFYGIGSILVIIILACLRIYRTISIRLLVSFRLFTQAEIYAPGRATAFLFQSPETKC